MTSPPAGIPSNSPQKSGGADAHGTAQPFRKVLGGSIVGTVVEYYDFGIYGYMATVLAALFFSASDPNAALLGTLAAFAVAFFLRIPGGLLFGHIGDKFGRKRALSWTIILMCIATLGIGFLPSYATLGIWATVLLVLLRCLQGIAAGGELGGATAFVAESAPKEKRATFTSLVNVGVNIGSLAAALLVLLMNTVFTPEQIASFAWRLPFLVSLPLAFVGIWIRSRMEDTPQFKELKDDGEVAEIPIKELFAGFKGAIIRIAGLSALYTGGYYVAFICGPIHMQTVGHQTPQLSFLSTCIALTIAAVLNPVAGRLSDRFGRRPVFIAAGITGVVVAVPAFSLMSSTSATLAIAANILLAIPVALSIGPAFSSFAEMLTAQVRYSGIALGMNFAQLVLGGTAPFVCAWLVQATGINLAPAGFFAVCAAIVLIAAWRMTETARTELRVD
jgi:MFS transporter, MHS family, proline/betaine transporter